MGRNNKMQQDYEYSQAINKYLDVQLIGHKKLYSIGDEKNSL
jgi:hypothetical protein